ncbi:hypothetical protein KCK31_000640 [Clostridium perfringens]|nr:hypothetical protein [Clostridium perfringens]
MKPILFNTAMVRAILDGEKTCTRRIIKKEIPEGYEPLGFVLYPTDDKELGNLVFGGKGANVYYAKPPYKAGDILYVRETWKRYEKRVGEGNSCRLTEFYGYKADEDKAGNPSEFYEGKWRPSIHMPKEAARIFLKVTSVRAERLQDIDEEQAKKYSWEGNPWVWVIGFKRIESVK